MGAGNDLALRGSRDVWDVVSPEVRAEFNRRLKAEGKPAGRWGADETAVQRLFGKELLVLLWAVELPDVKPEEITVAIRNWLGLKPEERWWLYTMTAAAAGLAHHAGMGWRGALRQALCFGTRNDAFNLGAVAGRGTLPPRPNPAAPAAVAVPKPKRAQGGSRRRGAPTTGNTGAEEACFQAESAACAAAAPKAKEPKAEIAAAKAKKPKQAPAEDEPKPKPKRQRAAKKSEASLFISPPPPNNRRRHAHRDRRPCHHRCAPRPRAVLLEGRAVFHRGTVSCRAAVGGGVQGAQGGRRANADRARLVLEGAQTAHPGARGGAGRLLPATDNPAKDLDIFLKLMAMDDAAFARRLKSVTAEDIPPAGPTT